MISRGNNLIIWKLKTCKLVDGAIFHHTFASKSTSGGYLSKYWPLEVFILMSDNALISGFGKALNTLRPRQERRHFTDNYFTCILFNENCCILIKFSLKYVRKGPDDNNPALVQIMAWRRSGDKSLSEPMMISLPMHICVIRPQWVNKFRRSMSSVLFYGKYMYWF